RHRHLPHLPGDQPAGELRRPRLRPGGPPGTGRGLAPGGVPERRHLPADLRRADRVAPQQLGRGLRAHRGLPGAGPGLRPRRRAPLAPHGGPTLIPYAEDVHTGLDVRSCGWSLVYLPVVLSTGICPNNLDAFVRQQYRWCTGNAGIVFSRRLWSIPMSVPARLTYISGFFYYVYTGLLCFFGPLIPIVMLAFLPGQVRLRNFVILAPAMISGFIVYPLWHRAAYGPSVWPLGVARGWAHVFSIWDSAWGRTMSWHPTRTPGSALPRFRIWVAGWSGGTALVWAVLAIWRTVTFGSAQFAVLVFFGML